ncbi:complement C1q tumor necrosis factor-related protein 3-like [Mytilus galloprovincialis]|uniref:complement C1q tumor necrosis factor-related protein 3-like n=1 Tax=Mytilus galloprovincialis TaxID=29158 RepID=UPI003F7B3659
MNTKMLQIYFTIILLLQIGPVLSQEDSKHTETRLQRLEILLDRQQAINKELQIEISECKSMKDKKRQNPPTAVAFSTQLATHLTGLGHHAAVIFDKVILDTTSSYNNGDGVFVVPITGIYVFTWTVSVGMDDWQNTELVVNGIPYAYTKVDSGTGSDYGSGTQIVVLKVNKRDHVWIRTGNIGNGVVDGNTFDTYSGWILFPME